MRPTRAFGFVLLALLLVHPAAFAQLTTGTISGFDRANFGTPDMVAFIDGQPNPNAGRITRTRTPARQMQIGLRWMF
ncbi:MAG: hypothetical protein HYU37_02960 [Acidobacteria bacterium]|nr:hypothetical protein [Acidobacteriota bacterium]